MKTAWITPKWPFPANDGARIATSQLIKNLANQNVQIHLISIVQEGEAVELERARAELGVECVTLIRRKQTSLFSHLINFTKKPFFPLTLASYSTSEITSEIAHTLKFKSFDLVVYDGLHAAAWKLGKNSTELKPYLEAYRAHNVESDIWFRGAKDTKNFFKKIILYFQGFLVKKAERELTAKTHYLFPVSTTDELKFKTYGTHGALRTLPIGMEVPVTRKTPPSHIDKNILFVGRLDWPPNRDGLKWVLENVWSKALQRTENLTLTIVGSGDARWLEDYRKLQGVKLMGRVDDLTTHYENCMATIIPVFYGSGTRVKAIESSLYSKACISTAIGVEGIGLHAGKSYLQAETAEDWIEAISTLKHEHATQIGEAAYLHACHAFDPKKIARTFIETVRAA